MKTKKVNPLVAGVSMGMLTDYEALFQLGEECETLEEFNARMLRHWEEARKREAKED